MAFDRWGRYLIVPPEGGAPVPHTRPTTLAGTLQDRFSLERWGLRVAGRGLAARSDLLAAVAATPDSDPNTLDDLLKQAQEAGGRSTSATLGTALHKFCERLDRGEELKVPAEWANDVDAYRRRLAEEGFSVEYVETTVVLSELVIAGTTDRIVERGGRRFVLDLKTGKDLKYAWPEIGCQLACYAHADSIYDLDTDQHKEMPEVSSEIGIVAHLPAGKGTCELAGVDLNVGWQGAQLALAIREYRKAGFRREWEVDAAITRREWLVRQVRRLMDDYPAAAADLAHLWPVDVPTLRSDGHTPEQLDQIAAVLQQVEGMHRIPFGDEPDPAHAKRQKKATNQ